MERETAQREAPASDAFEQLARDVRALVREELELARTEAVQRAREAAVGAGAVGAAGIFGLGAFGMGTYSVVKLAMHVLPRPIAPLAVGAGYAGTAVWLVRFGRDRLRSAVPTP
jgi:hypothetical protein